MSFLLLNTSTAVIFGWVTVDSFLSNQIPGKQRFKPIEQSCGLRTFNSANAGMFWTVYLFFINTKGKRKTLKTEIKITVCVHNTNKYYRLGRLRQYDEFHKIV